LSRKIVSAYNQAIAEFGYKWQPLTVLSYQSEIKIFNYCKLCWKQNLDPIDTLVEALRRNSNSDFWRSASTCNIFSLLKDDRVFQWAAMLVEGKASTMVVPKKHQEYLELEKEHGVAMMNFFDKEEAEQVRFWLINFYKEREQKK
jgi:hypothetical protein